MIICPVLWALFGLMALFTLKVKKIRNKFQNNVFIKFVWFTVCLTGFCFNGANLYGYIRCKVGGADAVKNMANKAGFYIDVSLSWL